MKLWIRSMLGWMVVLLLAACGAAATPTFTAVQPATISAGSAIPAPKDAVVLTLSGKIKQTNASGKLDFDMATLEQLGTVKYTVLDPFLKKDVTYEGVLLTTLLAAAQSDAAATTLQAVAINDYKVPMPMTVTKYAVLLATKRDGERMPVADKGPIEIVFPYNTEKLDHTLYDPFWVWQLRSLEVQ